jgi:hypothetical protein
MYEIYVPLQWHPLYWWEFKNMLLYWRKIDNIIILLNFFTFLTLSELPPISSNQNYAELAIKSNFRKLNRNIRITISITQNTLYYRVTLTNKSHRICAQIWWLSLKNFYSGIYDNTVLA